MASLEKKAVLDQLGLTEQQVTQPDWNTLAPLILERAAEIFHYWGQVLLNRLHDKVRNSETIPIGTIPAGTTVPMPEIPKEFPAKPITRVCIVGAGVAGLHAAMLLKEGQTEFDIDILEANDRIGGRLYTHRFSNRSVIGTPALGGEWDYFDVGAMRFPDTPLMQKTFELFKKLKIHLLPYNIQEEQRWLCYNNIRKTRSALQAETWASDPFKVSYKNGGNIPEPWASQDPSELLASEIRPFIIALAIDYKRALGIIIKYFDHYSTRSYLSALGYPPVVINWIETTSFGTGWFDRALIETILEELAFNYDQVSPTKLKWRCVSGGSEMIPIKMVEWLKENARKTNILTQHRVTAVEYMDGNLIVSGLCHPRRTGDPASFQKEYSHVIFAIPPPCLRMIDLDSCRLDYDQRNALRELQLASSCKIGIKFKNAWWGGPNSDVVGGQSTTDRPARTIVYPSHGSGSSKVLIASYAWTQDSLALGAMMKGPGSDEEERLKQLMLTDLAFIHQGQKDQNGNDITMESLVDEFEYMYAFEWSHNPLAMGAFGLFGPSQFRQFYRHITRPAACGQIHFVGETYSTIHGWVAGALESASRAVYQMLQLHMIANEGARDGEDLVEEYKKKWSPEIEVDEISLVYQLLVSWGLQQKEFGASA